MSGGRKCLRDSGTKQHVSIHHSSVRRKVSLLYANNPCGKAVNDLSFHSGLQDRRCKPAVADCTAGHNMHLSSDVTTCQHSLIKPTTNLPD